MINERPELRLIQKVVLGENAAMYVDGEKDFYYRSVRPIRFSSSNAWILEKDNNYDFFTLFNSLSIDIWSKYTYAENFALEIEAAGKFEVTLFGHYRTEDGYKKEWYGVYCYDLLEKKKILLPYPSPTYSTLVSFNFFAKNDTRIYDMSYVAKVPQERDVQVLLCAENEEIMTPCNKAFVESVAKDLTGVSYDWVDPKTFIQRKADYYVGIKNKLQLCRESLVRLGRFMKYLRREYQNQAIAALSFDIHDRVFQNAIDTSKHQANVDSDFGRLNMNIWSSLPESEYRIGEAGLYDYGLLFCPTAPTISMNSGNKKLIDSPPLTMNSIFVWTGEDNIDMGIRHIQADYGYSSAKAESDYRMPSSRMILQDIRLGSDIGDESTAELYYRGNTVLLADDRNGYKLQPGSFLDFFTYFNALSIEKWKKYTKAKAFDLELEFLGKIKVELFGHYINSRNEIKKEWLGRYEYEMPRRGVVAFEIPAGTLSAEVVAFQITAINEVRLYGGRYVTYIDKQEVEQPHVAMVTTTYKKEDYIHRNVNILKKSLFDSLDKTGFKWFIVDNGQSLDPKDIEDENITIIPNKNVGGAGGFTCGMIKALDSDENLTHILLMDDDVLFQPDSFMRLYRILSIIKPEYKSHFVSGAMLEINDKTVQHEDVGYISDLGEHGPVKPRYDLRLWDSVIRNEQIIDDKDKAYAGWWYCCIPATIARRDNLPLPFFIRGDDVEYSIRNKAKFITMNGICIWHEGFGTKFSGALELYQVHRNDLILSAIHKQADQAVIVQRMKWLFWEEIYKFNYKGANLLLDAVEDYLKGPHFIKTLNGEQCMKDHKSKDNILQPITGEIESKFSTEIQHLYDRGQLPKGKKVLYDHSCNGQKLPRFLAKRKTGVIPYGWGYYNDKMYMVTNNIAIDPINRLYVEYTRNDAEYKKAKQRFNSLMKRFDAENDSISTAYKEELGEMTSVEFWEEYLE